MAEDAPNFDQLVVQTMAQCYGRTLQTSEVLELMARLSATVHAERGVSQRLIKDLKALVAAAASVAQVERADTPVKSPGPQVDPETSTSHEVCRRLITALQTQVKAANDRHRQSTTDADESKGRVNPAEKNYPERHTSEQLQPGTIDIREIMSMHEEIIKNIRSSHDLATNNLKNDHQQEKRSMGVLHQEETENAESNHRKDIERIKKEYRNEFDGMQTRHLQEIEVLNARMTQLTDISNGDNEIRGLKREIEALRQGKNKLASTTEAGKEIMQLNITIEGMRTELNKLRTNTEAGKEIEGLKSAHETEIKNLKTKFHLATDKTETGKEIRKLKSACGEHAGEKARLNKTIQGLKNEIKKLSSGSSTSVAPSSKLAGPKPVVRLPNHPNKVQIPESTISSHSFKADSSFGKPSYGPEYFYNKKRALSDAGDEPLSKKAKVAPVSTRRTPVCETCRDAILECNGLSPCQNCWSGKLTCVYNLCPAGKACEVMACCYVHTPDSAVDEMFEDTPESLALQRAAFEREIFAVDEDELRARFDSGVDVDTLLGGDRLLDDTQVFQ